MNLYSSMIDSNSSSQ